MAEQIKISELATADISLSDFIVKANESGVASKNTIENLATILSTTGDVAFKGKLLIADTPSIDGWYFAGESGTYTNAGSLVVDIENNLVIIIVSGTQTSFSKVDIPLNINIATEIATGNTGVAVSGDVADYVEVKKTEAVSESNTYADENKLAKDVVFYNELKLKTVSDVSTITPNGLTINSLTNGALDVTLSRTYPWITLDTEIYEFILDADSKYLVIAKDSDSILAVTLDASVNSCRIFRFTDSDGISSVVTNLPNVLIGMGSTITAYRIGTVITIYDDGVLFFTYDYSASSAPEFSNPVFGNVFTASGEQLTGIKAGVYDEINRITELENEVNNTYPDTTELQGEDIADAGDSILAQNGMQPILKTRFGNATNQSLAVSGKRFTGSDASAITQQIQNFTGNPKLILMGGGTNDFGNNVALGNIGSSDTDEFYGAINFCANYLVTNYTQSNILWLGLPFGDWQTANGFAMGQVNSLGLSRYDYDDACRQVARNYGITYISQLEELGWNLTNIDDKTYDRIHPSPEGSQDRADLVSKYINKIFI